MNLIEIVTKCEQSLLNFGKKLPHASPNVRKLWEEQVNLHSYLHKSCPLIQVREITWESIKAMDDENNRLERLKLNRSNSALSPDTWTFNAMDVEFSVARYLALLSYTTTTWAIYDNLFNVVGRIAAIPEVGAGMNRNPKLQSLYDLKTHVVNGSDENENTNDKQKKSYLFHKSVHDFAIEQFAWPCAFSYEIRNWLVHDGMYRGKTPLFKGDGITDGFVVSVLSKKLTGM